MRTRRDSQQAHAAAPTPVTVIASDAPCGSAGNVCTANTPTSRATLASGTPALSACSGNVRVLPSRTSLQG